MASTHMTGFSFGGRHSGEFGLWYIPSPANRMQSTPDYELRETTVTGHDGGYYYGSQVKIREFTLECFFEDITMETYENMMNWIHRTNMGDQIFDERPFVTYRAAIWKKPTGKVYTIREDSDLEETYSGTMSLFFKCYDPFGKMNYIAYDTYDTDGAMKHCGIVEANEMPPAVTTTLGTHLVYNPGSEKCDTVIRIGGAAPNGLTITNSSGDVCKILSLPSTGYLEINSEYGTVKDMPTDELAFERHDQGYIRLDPCTPYRRSVMATYTEGSNVVSLFAHKASDLIEGKYIRLNGEWLRIASILSEDSIVVNKNMSATGAELAMIATMNELDVSGEGAELTQFEILYTPLLR